MYQAVLLTALVTAPWARGATPCVTDGGALRASFAEAENPNVRMTYQAKNGQTMSGTTMIPYSESVFPDRDVRWNQLGTEGGKVDPCREHYPLDTYSVPMPSTQCILYSYFDRAFVQCLLALGVRFTAASTLPKAQILTCQQTLSRILLVLSDYRGPQYVTGIRLASLCC